MKKQIHLFLTALMFYTRIPVPIQIPYSAELLNQSTRYFTLIGWIMGGFGGFVFWGMQHFFSFSLALLLSMIATILITGCFHEDGFADFCDAFGGGWNKEKILEIMKDSRLGTYGTAGLVFMLATKFLALQSFLDAQIPLVLFAGHTISRFAAINVIFFSTYSRMDELSKTKPIGKRSNWYDYAIAASFGIIPLVFFGKILIFLCLPILAILVYFLKTYFEKWIDGYTGDCLGATQQLAEITFYLSCIVLQKL